MARNRDLVSTVSQLDFSYKHIEILTKKLKSGEARYRELSQTAVLYEEASPEISTRGIKMFAYEHPTESDDRDETFFSK